MPEQSVEVIPWREFQNSIAPMWGIDDPATIPIINNPYRVIQFDPSRWTSNIIHYPIRYIENGVVKGYTCVYNVSRTVVRIRGIFILPEYRGNGAGMRMTKAVMSLFPTGFNRMVGFFKETTMQSFIDHCSFKPVPNLDWLWSEFQQVRIRVMYWDRWAKLSAPYNEFFIDGELAEHGFGGTNNLNRTWTDEEWMAFVAPHANVYDDVGLNVDF
jgi:hypothetical protein